VFARGRQASREKVKISQNKIEAEIRSRADACLKERRLVVDYYRIHRKLAYPLPIQGLPRPEVVVPSIPAYPWAIWLLWTLEERIGCLGWAAEWFGDDLARQAVVADLSALASWPEYAEQGSLGLASAHAGRLMWMACAHWPWLGNELRGRLAQACHRLVDEVLSDSNRNHGAFGNAEELLAAGHPEILLHNIPVIGTMGAALAARAAGHPAAPMLSQRAATVFGAILELRGQGHVEGVGYDGYLLDFVANWLSILPSAECNAFINHPGFAGYLEESYMLAAPGTAEEVAALSDVEPREMPFHLSAQAKLLALQSNSVRSWHLARCRPEWLRADALAALRSVADALQGEAPPAGALDAHYAVALRSGWEEEDLAVAMACSSSPMNHIQCDNGSILVGTRKRWIIADPGYQQYVQGAGREFTLGPVAHNAPVVDGQCQSRKLPKLLSLESHGARLHQATVELAACYPSRLQLQSVRRTLWCSGSNLVVVADQVAAGSNSLRYHWHGHRDAAWNIDGDWAFVQLAGSNLWIHSPQTQAAHLRLIDGSRGELTLVSEADVEAPVVWWVFALGAEPPAIKTRPDGKAIAVASQGFSLPGGFPFSVQN